MGRFLKTKNVDVDGEMVTITQLSGLERHEYFEFCETLPKPINPPPPPDTASSEEKKCYLADVNRQFNLHNKSIFVAMARLAALGCKSDEFGETLEERQQHIMENLSDTQIKFLHDEVAIFSGMITLELEEKEGGSEAELVDPKRDLKKKKSLHNI